MSSASSKESSSNFENINHRILNNYYYGISCRFHIAIHTREKKRRHMQGICKERQLFLRLICKHLWPKVGEWKSDLSFRSIARHGAERPTTETTIFPGISSLYFWIVRWYGTSGDEHCHQHVSQNGSQCSRNRIRGESGYHDAGREFRSRIAHSVSTFGIVSCDKVHCE